LVTVQGGKPSAGYASPWPPVLPEKSAKPARGRGQDPDRIGAALHTRFNQSYTGGTLITPEQTAAALIAHLGGDDSGSIWDVSGATARV
jgi:hypothetical protein